MHVRGYDHVGVVGYIVASATIQSGEFCVRLESCSTHQQSVALLPSFFASSILPGSFLYIARCGLTKYILSLSFLTSRAHSSYLIDARKSPSIRQFQIADAHHSNDPSCARLSGRVVFCPSQHLFFLASGVCIIRRTSQPCVHVNDIVVMRNVHCYSLSSSSSSLTMSSAGTSSNQMDGQSFVFLCEFSSVGSLILFFSLMDSFNSFISNPAEIKINIKIKIKMSTVQGMRMRTRVLLPFHLLWWCILQSLFSRFGMWYLFEMNRGDLLIFLFLIFFIWSRMIIQRMESYE